MIELGEGTIMSPKATVYGMLVAGKNSRIDDGCIFTGNVVLGDYVHIAPYCLFYGKAGIEVCDYAGVGAMSVLHSEADDYSGLSICSPLVPATHRKPTKGKITLRRFANLGTRCTIMPGVTLEVGAAVGAHSFVKKDCMEWGIYAGQPARWIKSRDRNCEGLAAELAGTAFL